MNTDAESTDPPPLENGPKIQTMTNGQQMWKSIPFWVPTISLICALGSCFNSNRSANAANRSADAAATSASAALTNADWVNYQRNPHHDVIATVLRFSTIMAGWSSEDTNGLAYVDLALINNGNQSEIIRRVTFYYCDRDDPNSGMTEPHFLNSQLPKGDKQVIHLKLDRRSAFSGKAVWFYMGVTAIGPDAQDLESRWLVTNFTLATNGMGGQWSAYSTKQIQLISNERLPTQHEQGPGTPPGFF